MSPLRDALKKAVAIFLPCSSETGKRGFACWTWLRARLASCLHVAGSRLIASAIWLKS
jgi:hypothetical protein